MRAALWIMVIMCCFSLVSCKEDKEDNAKKLYGYWRCEKEGMGGFQSISFTDKEFYFGSSVPHTRSERIAYEHRDGVIAIRKAGTERVILTSDFIDNNKIKTTYNTLCFQGIFVKSTPEEINNLNVEWKQKRDEARRKLEEEMDKPF